MMIVKVDNDASRAIAESGESKKLRYMNKQQRVRQSFVRDSLYERHHDRQVARVDTLDNKADMLTKDLDRLQHQAALSMASMMSMSDYKAMMKGKYALVRRDGTA